MLDNTVGDTLKQFIYDLKLIKMKSFNFNVSFFIWVNLLFCIIYEFFKK